MDLLRQAAQQMVTAMESHPNSMVESPENCWNYTRDLALDALRAALAQPEPVMFNGLTEAETNASASVMGLTRPEPEPVAWMYEGEPYFDGKGYRFEWRYTDSKSLAEFKSGTVKKPFPLYTAPPQRKPLTEEEIEAVCAPLGFAKLSPVEVARAIERAHGITKRD